MNSVLFSLWCPNFTNQHIFQETKTLNFGPNGCFSNFDEKSTTTYHIPPSITSSTTIPDLDKTIYSNNTIRLRFCSEIILFVVILRNLTDNITYETVIRTFIYIKKIDFYYNKILQQQYTINEEFKIKIYYLQR